MKRFFFIFSILLFTFFIQGCKSNRSEVAVRFSDEVTCEQIDAVFIGVPLNMSINKDDLFIGDSHEPMIIHYNLREKKTDRFLSKGRGPGETLSPVALYANPFGDKKLYRYSKQAFDMGFYPLDSLPVFVPLFKLPFGYSDVIPYEKDRFLSAGLFRDEYRYRVLNAEGTVVDRFGDYPDFLEGENLIPLDARAMFHQVRFANSYPKKKLVAASSYVVDIIDYSLDITNESIKRILVTSYDYDYGSGLHIWTQEKRGIAKGVSSVACDDKYIYLLFDPSMVREEDKGVKKEIWIFDWDGQLIEKLKLDIDVKKITADPYSDEHTVFGIAYEITDDDEHYKIVKVKVNL